MVWKSKGVFEVMLSRIVGRRQEGTCGGRGWSRGGRGCAEMVVI